MNEELTKSCEIQKGKKQGYTPSSPLLFFREVCKLMALIDHLILNLESPSGGMDVLMEKLRESGCTGWV